VWTLPRTTLPPPPPILLPQRPTSGTVPSNQPHHGNIPARADCPQDDAAPNPHQSSSHRGPPRGLSHQTNRTTETSQRVRTVPKTTMPPPRPILLPQRPTSGTVPSNQPHHGNIPARVDCPQDDAAPNPHQSSSHRGPPRGLSHQTNRTTETSERVWTVPRLRCSYPHRASSSSNHRTHPSPPHHFPRRPQHPSLPSRQRLRRLPPPDPDYCQRVTAADGA